MIGKVEKKGCGAPLFALEKHGQEGGSQHERGRHFQPSDAHQLTAAFAQGAVARLDRGFADKPESANPPNPRARALAPFAERRITTVINIGLLQGLAQIL